MTIQWWQILLLTCLAFWAIIDQLTVSIVNNPLKSAEQVASLRGVSVQHLAE